ncbi:hypothetical protein [Tellurirhabdus rosea]|uniref:hypothetical protein n=1 Tax=Tellurirhabdus rosea TaxID=2674997 RepID=UPI0022535571|nr:hypothetical protein [Tellurirhabdus rosea]
MKNLLFVACLLLTLTGMAQSNRQKVTGPVTSRRGIELKEGDILRLGEGTGSGRSFRHVFTSINRLGQEASQIDGGYQYVNTTIKEFYEVGTGANRRLIVLVRPKGDMNLNMKAVDLESAIESKEVISLNGTSLYKLMRKETSKR